MFEKGEGCPNQGAPYLKAQDTDSNSVYVLKARCKLWSCDYCSKVNAHQHWIRILNGVNELSNTGQQFSFVTITASPKLKNAEQCLYVWRKAWRILRERLRRHHEKNHDYEMVFCIVTELHKNGRLHWHMLINSVHKSRWYKDNASEVGLGHQCKAITMENTVQGANYVTKYLSKNMGQEGYPKKMRRIVYSQSFPDKPTPEAKFNWQVLDTKESIVSVIEHAWRMDYDAYLNWVRIDEILD